MPKKVKRQPLGARMSEDLDSIEDRLAAVLRTIRVKPIALHHPIGIVAPHFHWDRCSPEQEFQLTAVKRDYEDFCELLRQLLRGAPDSVIRKMQEADRGVREWIERKASYAIRPNAEMGIREMRKAAGAFRELLSIMAAAEDGPPLVVPDTNTLIDHPDPREYRDQVGDKAFSLVLLPSVLEELEKLRIGHRHDEIRDKAKAVIRRIKGWRAQGSLSEGVTVDKTITVTAEHAEPDMSRSLSWLDPTVNDDRIVASVLELEAKYLNRPVLLATADINLQNKADAAKIAILDLDY